MPSAGSELGDHQHLHVIKKFIRLCNVSHPRISTSIIKEANFSQPDRAQQTALVELSTNF